MRNKRKPNVVVIGGGTGLSVMLRGLKRRPLNLTAIVTVADDGGSSGKLRSAMHMPPPGDIRNVIMALSDVEPLLSEVFAYRFAGETGEGLAGHSLGNLILAALHDITGDFVTGTQELSRILAVRGRVLPAAGRAVILKAELEDGRIVVGESNIPKSGGIIKRVMIDPPDVKPLNDTLEAIASADAIIIGPGSLYTSILPNLLVPGIAKALVASPAIKIFICNVMTQPGETDRFNVGDHIMAIKRHLPELQFDMTIVNDGGIDAEMLRKYAEDGAEPVQIDQSRLRDMGIEIVSDKLALALSVVRHDAMKLSELINRAVRLHIAEAGAIHYRVRSSEEA